jgi:thioredoxin-related protein
MFLIICIILFVVFCIIEASGKDWERGQMNAYDRTEKIMSAIYGATDELKSEYKYVQQDQTDYFEQFKEDTEKESEFQDEHGRWFRKRLIYSPEGKVIAEETIGVER